MEYVLHLNSSSVCPTTLLQWFGHYSFGHNGGKWNYNYVHDNFGYGFDPHDDSDNLEMIGNVVFNNQWHGMSEYSIHETLIGRT